MSEPTSSTQVLVIFGGDSAMRRYADQHARAVGWRTRMASRPAELIKALDDTVEQVWLLDTEVVAAISERMPRNAANHARTPGETIEAFVSRALSA